MGCKVFLYTINSEKGQLACCWTFFSDWLPITKSTCFIWLDPKNCAAILLVESVLLPSKLGLNPCCCSLFLVPPERTAIFLVDKNALLHGCAKKESTQLGELKNTQSIAALVGSWASITSIFMSDCAKKGCCHCCSTTAWMAFVCSGERLMKTDFFFAL